MSQVRQVQPPVILGHGQDSVRRERFIDKRIKASDVDETALDIGRGVLVLIESTNTDSATRNEIIDCLASGDAIRGMQVLLDVCHIKAREDAVSPDAATSREERHDAIIAEQVETDEEAKSAEVVTHPVTKAHDAKAQAEPTPIAPPKKTVTGPTESAPVVGRVKTPGIGKA